MGADPVSPLNSLGELQTARRIPPAVQVNDVTLREAEQSIGVRFDVGAKVQLAQLLARIGVASIQVGYPGRFDEDMRAVGAVCNAVDSATVEAVALAFVPDWEAELDACLASGAGVIHIVSRASDRLHRLLGTTRVDVLERTRAAIRRALKEGAAVAFTPSDSTRADPAFLVELWRAAAEAGAGRIYVADSVGVATPELIALLVRLATEATELPVGVHCHNDFGLAVANTVAGVMAGADRVDVAVNGLGDRAGNAPLEEVVAALELLYDLRTGMSIGSLTELSTTFAEATGRELPLGKPITGSAVFAHVLPTHTAVMESDRRAIQPFEAELVGNVGRLAPRDSMR
jgi:isopropylmalate/homocitrate/citramalate synthase